MKKILSLLILTLISHSALSNTLAACEAFALEGEHKSLKPNVYQKIFPTIIIQEDSKTLTYVYSQHGMKWETEYNITLQNDNRLVGISNFDPDVLKIIHYEISTGRFTIFFSGSIDDASPLVNTMTAGRCIQ